MRNREFYPISAAVTTAIWTLIRWPSALRRDLRAPAGRRLARRASFA